ncbi:DUF4190 domain-containing protein [Gordonia insulae]|uniref:DUF4190 domain-containing protein n=1 Tax=Gordonia insulae TaxID=2420509 RepID=A0A3G8JW00_9ACTN|nr:DUF4190 domain-containing protein [Gordonia insulae]AZG48360.1 hypothetical protein D7316_04977 [Gordonia insulae]
MRVTDHPTQPIPPAVTDRILTWPPPQDTGDFGAVGSARLPEVTTPAVSAPAAPEPAVALPAHTRVVDGPLPPLGEVWDLPTPGTVRPLGPVPGHPSTRRPTVAAATAGLVTSLVSLPLALIGIGAVVGLIGVVLGIVGLVQISSRKRMAAGQAGIRQADVARTRGTGRAVAAIIMGTASVVVGAPILLVILALMAVF